MYIPLWGLKNLGQYDRPRVLGFEPVDGVLVVLKGIVHLNIIFSYMKFNKICNLDHPVY